MRMEMVKMMSIFLKFFLGKGYKTTVVKVGRIKLYNRYSKELGVKS